MSEPMTLTALAGVLAVTAVGFYLRRVIVRLPRRGARSFADEPDNCTPTVGHAVDHAEPRTSRNPQRGIDHYRGRDGKSPRSAASLGLFARRGPTGIGSRAVGLRTGAGSAASAKGGARNQKTLYQPHRQGTAPDAPDNLRLAVRAVHLHTASQWPGGLYCAKDQSPFPCRLRRWGEGVLLSAGWSADDIADLGQPADAEEPPFR